MDNFDFKPLGSGERKEIIEYIRSRIDDADPDSLRKAMLSMGWASEGAGELVEPLMLLLTEGRPEIALIALDGLAQLESKYCEKPLARHIVNLFKQADPACSEVRSECIRVLGKVGSKHCVSLLAELIRNPATASEEDKEAAVEALVSLAERKVRGITETLEGLKPGATGNTGKAIQCALKELNLQRWEEQGFLTIEADLEREEDKLGG
ncbi:MAG: HEAT repeat domain-containing protein [Gemmatimonadota bacterium]|nr:HEAT repeat domain-containing protein [Gemmatimonadota bacterium]